MCYRERLPPHTTWQNSSGNSFCAQILCCDLSIGAGDFLEHVTLHRSPRLQGEDGSEVPGTD